MPGPGVFVVYIIFLEYDFFFLHRSSIERLGEKLNFLILFAYSLFFLTCHSFELCLFGLFSLFVCVGGNHLVSG